MLSSFATLYIAGTGRATASLNAHVKRNLSMAIIIPLLRFIPAEVLRYFAAIIMANLIISKIEGSAQVKPCDGEAKSI